MNTFFSKTFKTFLIFASLFTASAGLLAVSPKLITALFLVPFDLEYQLLIQHWGLTTFVIGLFLLLSIRLQTWQTPIILLAGIEKIYMVVLYLSLEHVEGYQNVAIVDSMIAIYFMSYLYTSLLEARRLNSSIV